MKCTPVKWAKCDVGRTPPQQSRTPDTGYPCRSTLPFGEAFCCKMPLSLGNTLAVFVSVSISNVFPCGNIVERGKLKY